MNRRNNKIIINAWSKGCALFHYKNGGDNIEKRYIISEASKNVGVEPHVLRYWEEELGLEILRNELGHRYYREEDINILRSVKDLKDKGFQLKIVRVLLPELSRLETLDNDKLLDLRDKLDEALYLAEGSSDMLQKEGEEAQRAKLSTEEGAVSVGQDKLRQFRGMMSDIVSEALLANNEIVSRKISNSVRESVIKELNYIYRTAEEKQEERFRQLDRTIREYQQGKQQAAVTVDGKRKKRFKLKWRNKK